MTAVDYLNIFYSVVRLWYMGKFRLVKLVLSSDDNCQCWLICNNDLSYSLNQEKEEVCLMIILMAISNQKKEKASQKET